MLEKSVLVGNGINIAFSENDDYKNFKIIDRLQKYLKTNRYEDVFAGTITAAELSTLLSYLNTFFNKMTKGVDALKYTKTKDEMVTLKDISKRYHGKSSGIMDVGIEDYFFAMHLFNLSLGPAAVEIETVFTGLRWLFLDAIYNTGEIEKLYEKMDCFKGELQKFNSIFTVNYDTNLDKLTDKDVYHLHGSYAILDDTYNPSSLIGYLSQGNRSQPKNILSMKHLYCNSVMEYSGEKKMYKMQLNTDMNEALDVVLLRIQDHHDVEVQKSYSDLKQSILEEDIYKCNTIKARLAHPELKHTEYPVKQFRYIKGELHIIGMSPNNDHHIFKMINENSNLTKVIYYSANNDDSINVKRIIKKRIEIIDVYDYWNSIKI